MKFLFACGGTAGHINPALAVAGRLKELLPDNEFLFAGAEGKMEMELVPRSGYRIESLPISNLSRGHDLEAVKHNLEAAKNVVRSLHAARTLIRDFQPDAVIGTGGYVCFPVLTAAHEKKIPTVVHESNAVPGLTTKLLANQVDKILVGFEESRAHYHHPERVEVTGTPVRGEFSRYTKERAKAELGIPADRPLVVSVWGSLGAGRMNEIMTELIPMLGETPPFRLIHSAGSRYYAGMSGKLQETAPDCAAGGIEVREYIYDMPRVMAAADLILCRAGASTIAELTYMGKPVIMVPSPNVTNHHQEKNARVLENAGGARVLLEEELDASVMLTAIRELLSDSERLNNMSHAMKSLAVSDATDKIASIILELTQ